MTLRKKAPVFLAEKVFGSGEKITDDTFWHFSPVQFPMQQTQLVMLVSKSFQQVKSLRNSLMENIQTFIFVTPKLSTKVFDYEYGDEVIFFGNVGIYLNIFQKLRQCTQ